jgi:hypothetical protein
MQEPCIETNSNSVGQEILKLEASLRCAPEATTDTQLESQEPGSHNVIHSVQAL